MILFWLFGRSDVALFHHVGLECDGLVETGGGRCLQRTVRQRVECVVVSSGPWSRLRSPRDVVVLPVNLPVHHQLRLLGHRALAMVSLEASLWSVQ